MDFLSCSAHLVLFLLSHLLHVCLLLLCFACHLYDLFGTADALRLPVPFMPIVVLPFVMISFFLGYVSMYIISMA